MSSIPELISRVQLFLTKAGPTSESMDIGVQMIIEKLATVNQKITSHIITRIKDHQLAETYKDVQREAEEFLSHQVIIREATGGAKAATQEQQERGQQQN